MASEDDRGTTDGGCQIMDNTDLLDIMDSPSDFHDGKYAAYGRLGDRVVCSLYRNWIKRSLCAVGGNAGAYIP